VLDTRHETVALLAKASAAVKQPRLPLGSKGTLRGEAVEIIGYMRRCMFADGVSYCWGEYVCLGPDNTLLWLTEYDGHWNLARVASRALRVVGNVRYDEEDFKHFQGYQARVEYVIGEFPWRVAIDESAQVDDYVAPPRMVSRERTQNEETWTVAEYVEPAEIAAAFALKTDLPKPVGVFANQPNPHEARHRSVCSLFWKVALAGFAIHLLLLLFGPGGTLLKQELSFAKNEDEPKVMPEFKLTGEANRLEIAHHAAITNNWLGLNMTLVNKDTGHAWQESREISRYEGVDGGESWSEGSRDAEIVFADLPAGTYVLAIEHDMDPNSGPLRSQLVVARPGPRWSSLILFWLALVPFPIWTRIRRGAFEVKRWAESDHPIVTSGDDGDD
jgi:hypothetical protein